LQKKTIEAILESRNDYVIQVKGNQKTLKSDLMNYTGVASPKTIHKTLDLKRGRKDYRSYFTYSIPSNYLLSKWRSVKTVTVVQRYGTRNGVLYNNTALYISNLKLSAEEFSKGIRGHWQIENNLHRVKDVFQKEDVNMIKSIKLASVVSILQTTTINLFRLAGMKSIKKANEKFANNVSQSFQLITNELCI